MDNKNNTDGFVRFMYDTWIGNLLLRVIMRTHADRIAVSFLKSALSGFVIRKYAAKHGIKCSEEELASYHTFNDFFSRKKSVFSMDYENNHLISPCDGWLSVYHIDDDSSFTIKGSSYRISDLIKDRDVAEWYMGGLCLVIRLCASDYHHYCYIDDCWQGDNHYIPGELHSVQPAALSRYPVFALNRRSWCILETDHFGSVVQTEIGALVVGGIINPYSNMRRMRGEEKGHFELSGSTIVIMFEPGEVKLLPGFECGTPDNEVRVKQGMWIGVGKPTKNDPWKF